MIRRSQPAPPRHPVSCADLEIRLDMHPKIADLRADGYLDYEARLEAKNSLMDRGRAMAAKVVTRNTVTASPAETPVTTVKDVLGQEAVVDGNSAGEFAEVLSMLEEMRYERSDR